MSNYDKRSFGKFRLILIREELLRLNSHLATSMWEEQLMALYVYNNIGAWEAHMRLEDTCPL